MAIPSGQLKYPRVQNHTAQAAETPAEEAHDDKETEQNMENTNVNIGEAVAGGDGTRDEDATVRTEISNNGIVPQIEAPLASDRLRAHQKLNDSNNNSSSAEEDTIASANGAEAAHSEKKASKNSSTIIAMEPPTTNGTAKDDQTDNRLSDPDAGDQEQIAGNNQATLAGEDGQKPGSIDEVTVIENGRAVGGDQNRLPTEPKTGCYLYEVWKPNGLENKIIEIDGRLDPKDAPIASSWRFIRVQRNNQDLGSLFDMREEFYVWKSPTIVKTPKKGPRQQNVQVHEEGSEDCAEQPRTNSKAATKKRAPKSTSPSITNPKRSRKPKESQTNERDDKAGDNIMEDIEDEESEPEPDSDDDFVMNGPRSAKSKSKQRSKRGTRRSQIAANEENDAAQSMNQAEDEDSSQRTKAKQIHFCKYCLGIFATDWTLRRHIKDSCKRVSSN